MIDIHCHIIPNIDDGSNGLDKSITQLENMERGGIKKVYLTSHYFRGHYYYSRAEYDSKMNALAQAAKQAGLDICLQSGFEIFIQPGICEDIKAKNLTLGDSPYVLIESELNGLPSDFYDNVYPLLRAGYKPILAHAERYVSIMKKPGRVRELNDKNIYVQTNAGALVGLYGEKVRQTAWTIIENGWSHFVASDDHVRGEYSAMFDAYELISDRIDEHTANLLCKEFPAAIASEEKIPYSYVHIHTLRKHHHRSWFRSIFG
ncbi:MAG: capsular biosynthesis protein [Candidatus Cloacimonetes bacterium]|nr:capsular biosynthesis protein [Candidatus Cloacimonadota bacterium]